MKYYYPLPQILFTTLFIALCSGPLLSSDATNCTIEEGLFHIECPPDTTVYCGADIYDLSGYGWAYVYGYGSPEPAGPPVVNYNLNSCGIGTITRTWYAYDYSGNQYSCTQVITVLGGGYFNGSDIHWPKDYHTYDCGASLHPSDLPHPYNYPYWYNVGDCVDLMYTYDDLVFEINPPACIKILREWTVIDWCSYQPNNPYHHGGIWKHTQVLKVKTHDKPSLNCPSDTMVSADNDCHGAYVHLPPATGMGACGIDVNITNNSPYANSNGADASGYYPLGTTKVIFTAEDLCGNKETCTVYITVKDLKKPTPICLHGVSSTLSLMSDGYYLDLQPRFFNKGSYDNCTPKHQLRFEVYPKRLTCEDLGENQVKLVVIDASGNSQYCTTYIDLQDNMGMCPPDTSTMTLTGSVVDLSGQSMAGLQIVDTETGNQSITDAGGAFSIPIYQNNTVHLAPLDMESGLEGVTVYDLLLMQMNILGEYDFQHPAAALSADVNGNEDVSVSDIASLQMQLLGYDHDMPMGYWGFVLVEDLSEEQIELGFEEPVRWFTEDQVDNGAHTAYFVGFPLGDVDGSSMDALYQSGIEDRSQTDYPVTVRKNGESIEFVAGGAIESMGMQMQWQLPGTEWKKDDLQNGVLPVETASSLISEKNETVLTLAMPLHREVPVQKGDVLFSLRSKSALQHKKLSAYFSDQNSGLRPEMYSSGLEIHDIIWRFEEAESLDALTMNVYPNPFEDQITVEYYVPEQGEAVALSVSDMTGKIVYRAEWSGNKTGWHKRVLDGSGQWPVGMYHMRLGNARDQYQSRVIKTK